MRHDFCDIQPAAGAAVAVALGTGARRSSRCLLVGLVCSPAEGNRGVFSRTYMWGVGSALHIDISYGSGIVVALLREETDERANSRPSNVGKNVGPMQTPPDQDQD